MPVNIGINICRSSSVYYQSGYSDIMYKCGGTDIHILTVLIDFVSN